MHQHIINLDNAVTLLRLKRLESLLTTDEQFKLNQAITRLINKINVDCGEPGFDTAAAFQEFFGRPIK